MTLEDYEAAIKESGIMDKIRKLIEDGMGSIKVQDIEAIELIGGASRVRSISALVAEIFGADKITKRMNPDEAVGFGLGWLGALRSSKYKIPYTIGLTDLITNLSAPITLSIINENGELAIAKPAEIYRNGDKFQSSKKTSFSFQPGKYTAVLKEGDYVHEETEFEVKPKDFEQFKKTDEIKKLAEDAKIDFEKISVSCTIRIAADQDGYFRISQISR